MFIDACAMVAIIMREDDAGRYNEALVGATSSFTSSLAAWEALIVLARPDKLDCSYSDAADAVLDWLDGWGVELREPAHPRNVLTLAAAVAEKHGLGRRTLSNFDCFHYAHAKLAGAPLLTLDRLLRETDVETLPS